jgi:hypothetical protein
MILSITKQNAKLSMTTSALQYFIVSVIVRQSVIMPSVVLLDVVAPYEKFDRLLHKGISVFTLM